MINFDRKCLSKIFMQKNQLNQVPKVPGSITGKEGGRRLKPPVAREL